MTRTLLLCEELALVAIKAGSGRHAAGTRCALNACLAGLVVAELVLEGHARPGEGKDTLVRTDGGTPGSPTLAAAAGVIATKGPTLKAVLSHMDRGLAGDLGRGTWDAAVGGLVEVGAASPAEGWARPHHGLLDRDRREAVVARLRDAAAEDRPLEPRTALLLAMTGPARLLRIVAPERGSRRHARRRIDHVLDDSPFEPILAAVKRLLSEAAAAGAMATAAGAMAAAAGAMAGFG